MIRQQQHLMLLLPEMYSWNELSTAETQSNQQMVELMMSHDYLNALVFEDDFSFELLGFEDGVLAPSQSLWLLQLLKLGHPDINY